MPLLNTKISLVKPPYHNPDLRRNHHSSTTDEITVIFNGLEENQGSKVLRNELDQAPKTGRNYLDRLNDPELKNAIIEAFDRPVQLDMSSELKEWFASNKDQLPISRILSKLEKGKTIAYKIHEAPGTGNQVLRSFLLLPSESVADEFLGEEQMMVQPGHRATMLLFERPITQGNAYIQVQAVEIQGAKSEDSIQVNMTNIDLPDLKGLN